MVAASSSERRRITRLQHARDVVDDVIQRRVRGEVVSDSQVIARHGDCMPELAEELAKLEQVSYALEQVTDQQCLSALDRLESDWREDSRRSRSRRADGRDSAEASTANQEDIASVQDPELPEKFGRYYVRRLLGEGGFGRVYLGWDDELQRQVAIKVAHAHRLRSRQETQAYLSEARLIASLDHPAIVPVFDAQRTDDGACYVVSKLISGTNLSQAIKRRAIGHAETLRLVVTIAEALGYAHRKGIIHRDIKPANILLADDGTPYVTDFGLALRDDDAFEGKSFAGTPAYMSPEQARGEAHRVDGRSDIFSLGVLMYELLTGCKPFRGDSDAELLDQILHQQPAALRDIDNTIPEELERICSKAMAKRASDRYPTVDELIDDLRHFERDQGTNSLVSATSPTEDPVAPIIPKGLRAFDSNDADFFLELVPGPRDRHGLPESIRRWKLRIEATDPAATFSVGVVYGPSGCGKSSFVQAGLLPRVSRHVTSVYVEATSDDLESRITQQLVRELGNETPADLTTLLTQVRRGDLLPGGKLLLVIDQFEQWLHGKTEEQRRELVEALRQCDGDRLQCLLLVRDDFWLALSRFMSELEVDLQQGTNTALVDLFDPLHAAKILTEFGRAFGRLPRGEFSVGQQEFVASAVEGLMDDGKIIPVRLALFAEMFKGKTWSKLALRQLGGTSGVGLAFLEETFSANAADPRNRLHERAARAVLEALMPAPGSNIRGHTRSAAELLDLSGYGHEPRKFKELMRILDSETRLLTPADAPTSDTESGAPSGQRSYQLTHDYLVPSLREWLTQRQKATRVGRAELRLAERSAMWNARPEIRQLPSAWEWLTIRALTRSAQWAEPQRRMMRAAARYYAVTFGCGALLFFAFLFAGSELATQVRNVLGKFRASTATVWLALGQEDAIWPLLAHDPDPTLRTRLIHNISPLAANAEEIVSSLDEQPDVSTQRAMLLLAGELTQDPEEHDPDAVSRRTPSEPMMQELLRIHRDAADSGIHAAAEWSLRRYGYTYELSNLSRLARDTIVGDRQWYVTSAGHTMMVVHGGAHFMMGSADGNTATEDEIPHRQMIQRSFSIAHREITVAQFEHFLRESREFKADGRRARSPRDAPRDSVTWYEAAAYCNWLSERAGLSDEEWCYARNATGKYGPGMRVATDFMQRRGYRLPTEAEWEYACRAGAETERFFGREPEMLKHYAVFDKVSPDEPLVVGWRKPNDFGLFDVHGNVAEWCHDRYYAKAGRALGSAEIVSDLDLRVVRGGAFRDPAGRIRSGSRSKSLPATRDVAIGFRVARSYP